MSDPKTTTRREARVAVLASGSGSNFEALCRAADQVLGAKVVGLVYNESGAGVAERARRLGVPNTFVDHREFPSRESFDRAVAHALRVYRPDVVAMAGWMRIATHVLLDAFPGRIVNIHPSLLPAYKGLDAIGQALRAGAAMTGCTVHVVMPELDGGPILGQAEVPVLPDDSLESLTERVHAAEHALYPRALAGFIDALESR